MSLALEPAAIEAVLLELRTYIRNGDKKFVCAAIRAVGRVAELARIVYDRHGQKTEDTMKERKTANRIALDCLYGLSVVTQTCDSKVVIGEAICVMQNIMVMLVSDAGDAGSLVNVEDPNGVQGFALRRIFLLMVNSLSNKVKNKEDDENEDSDKEEEEPSNLEKISIDLPPRAVASSLWMVGEWLSNTNDLQITLRNIGGSAKSQMRLEYARLVDRAFPELDLVEKEQGIHFASKLLVSSASSASGATPSSARENVICEHILSMGRVDVNPDVKDRARFESAIVHSCIGLKHDTDALDTLPSVGSALSIQNAKKMFLERKPAPSFLPVEDDNKVDTNSFRFGTLSSLVGHQARGAYLTLPPWGEKNSPKALRDPVEGVKEQVTPAQVTSFDRQRPSGFYGGSDSSGSSSSSSSSSSDSQQADSESDSDDSTDDSNSTSDSSDDGNNLLGSPKLQTVPTNGTQNNILATNLQQPMAQPVPVFQGNPTSQLSTSDDDSSSSDDGSSSSFSSDDNYNGGVSSVNMLASPREANLLSMGGGMPAAQKSGFESIPGATNRGSSAMDDLRGLVMAPIAVDENKASDPDIERDSSRWIQLVRPELCGGLSVHARYIRGPTREREVQLKGLDPRNSSVVCVQVKFRNK